MAKKKNKADKKRKKEEKKLRKQEKRAIKFIGKLPPNEKILISRFISECGDDDKKIKHFINQLPGGEKALIHRFMDVLDGKKIENKPISGNLQLRRDPGYFVNRKAEKRYQSLEPVAPGFADSGRQAEQPEQKRMEPIYAEPRPIEIDEKILDEFREELEEYFENDQGQPNNY